MSPVIRAVVGGGVAAYEHLAVLEVVLVGRGRSENKGGRVGHATKVPVGCGYDVGEYIG